MSPKEEQARKELFAEIQSTYLEWSNRVLVQACTGAGKCKIALDLFEEDLKAGEFLDIVVPQDAIIKDWEEEIVKWGYDKYRDLIELYCAKSLHKYKTPRNTIYDEAHTVTELSNQVMKAKTYTSKLVGLSATVSYDKMILLNELGLGEHNSVMYTLDDGVEDEIIVPYNVKVVSIPMDGTNKRVEVGYGKNRFKTTEVANYEYLTKRLETLEIEESLQELAGQDTSALQESVKFARLNRMRGVYNFPSKQLGAQYILSIIPEEKKLMGFCGGIPQCNALFKHRYHSKVDNTDFEKFRTGKLDRIGTVKAANMGINVSDLTVALVIQVQSKYIHLVQRGGRAFRKDPNDPTKKGLMIVLVSRDSVDEDWARKALDGNMDGARIEYLTIEEIIADNSKLFN